jgi:hypothetical protein
MFSWPVNYPVVELTCSAFNMCVSCTTQLGKISVYIVNAVSQAELICQSLRAYGVTVCPQEL